MFKNKKVLSLVLTMAIILTNLGVLNSYAATTYTDDLCTDGTKASASSVYTTRGASKAFDGDFTTDYKMTAWQSLAFAINSPQWIKYDFGEGNKKKITKYTIAPGYEVGYGPKDFIFQGSNDDVTWTNIDQRTNVVYPAVGTSVEFTTSNTSDFRYYRIYATSTVAGREVIINEIQMMEDAANPTIEMAIDALTYDIAAGTEFTVDVLIRNAQSIYAEEINLAYNSTLFQYVGAQPADAQALKIFNEDSTTSGQLKYIVASMGEAYSLNNEAQVLKLTFKAIGTGSGNIDVATGRAANGDGNEFDAVCFGKTFNVTGSADVNNDGKFTLGDLAIAAKLIATAQNVWGIFTPDTNLNGTVEDADLQTIVAAIISNL